VVVSRLLVRRSRRGYAVTAEGQK